MILPISPRERWTLSNDAFKRLLERLDPDPDCAAERFRVLQSKLVLFFTYNRCTRAEYWADECLDRLAKRLAEDQPISDINAFARGIARLVLREAQKQQQRERESLLAIQHTPTRAHDEQALRCLDRCLTTLTRESRELISRYYSGQEASRSPDRRKLAEELGLTIDGLRTRALRIRRELELCITCCRENGDPSL